MRRVALTFVALSFAVPSAAQTAAPFMSAMIDPTLFRDGEVQRSTGVYGSWTLVCDTVPRLGRRFCSLRSRPVPVGVATIDVTVSTGDDGRPAALLRLPFGLALAAGIKVGGGHLKARSIPIALCDIAGCSAVWTMSGAEIDALRRGEPLRVAMQGWTPGLKQEWRPPMMANIPGIGFSEAVAASFH